MKEKIENEYISVGISHAGAELNSVFHKLQQKEYLWQGSDAWWPRKAPVLFPVVGKLNNNSFSLNGKSFSLPQHGFARDETFSVLEQKSDMILFILRSDEQSLTRYPFPFELLIRYELNARTLNVTYEVRNTGTETMYFSIGAHPGFNCPLNADERFSDYYLEFEKEETLERHLLTEGTFNGATERVMSNAKILPLDEELFRKDAIVFKNMKSERICLKSKRSDYSLEFAFKDFPYFGIWTKPGAPFICLEPWCGIADNMNFKGGLKDKEGIVSLAPATDFIRSWSVKI